MSFDPIKGTYYRMPVFFGPVCGPRQWDVDERYDPQAQTSNIARFNFLTRAEQLQAFLPPRFSLWGEPVATLDVHYMQGIPWLAGRGYAMSDFKFMAVYDGKEGPVHGTFVLLRWENLADPIITGREELGHNKLYCEIPGLKSMGRRDRTELSWLGHQFAEAEFWDMEDAAPPAPDPLNQGQLSFKWTPKTGSPGEADAAYCTLSPLPAPGMNPAKVTSYRTGKGRFDYCQTTWEQFPFAFNVINAIADLDKLEDRGAIMMQTRGGGATSAGATRIIE